MPAEQTSLTRSNVIDVQEALGPDRPTDPAKPPFSIQSDPALSIADASVLEGHAGTAELEFELTLSSAATDTVTVDVEVVAGSASRLFTQRLTTGLSAPVYLTVAPGNDQTLFVVEQNGTLRRVDRQTGAINGTPFLSVSDLSTGGERGLLGLAFHPQFELNGYFYIYMTDTSGDTLIRRYTTRDDGVTADPASAQTVLGFDQPFSNHNAGWMDFGPDGYLYIASGDGGAGNDPRNNAQDLTDNLLGKMLRLDVDGDDFPSDANRNYRVPPSNPFVGIAGEDEIWSFGLRNPWRNSFDRQTGDLWIADVGQSEREEINVQLASSGGGENYGWRLREGTIATPNVGGAKPPGAIDPIYDYQHGSGNDEGFSVTGGYVYRGPVPELQGQYFFSDYVTNRIWSIRANQDQPFEFDGTNFADFTDWTDILRPDAGSIRNVSSFGEDHDGNLYIVDRDGEIYRLTDGADYQVTQESVTIEVGESVGRFSVPVLGDRLPEFNETLTVNLVGSVGAVIADGTATGTILNDDAPVVSELQFGDGTSQRSRIDAITVTFDSPVSLDSQSENVFRLTNPQLNRDIPVTAVSQVINGRTTTTLAFVAGPSTRMLSDGSVVLGDGFYELTIQSAGIEIGGVAFDGDEDGVAGGDQVVGNQRTDAFFALFGDHDGDADVDRFDLQAFAAAYQTELTDTDFDGRFDWNGDEAIDALDYAAFRRRFGRRI